MWGKARRICKVLPQGEEELCRFDESFKRLKISSSEGTRKKDKEGTPGRGKSVKVGESKKEIRDPRKDLKIYSGGNYR